MAQLQTVLESAVKSFADKRIHLCNLTIKDENKKIILSGSVLDDETVTAVIHHLQTNLPNQTIDSSQVTVLRQAKPIWLQVSTPITTLYNDPGFRSEPATQLLIGQTVEHLKEDESWVFVRQLDGYLGWIYRPYLSNAVNQDNDHWVHKPVGLLKSDPNDEAPLVSRVLGGTAVSIQSIKNEWAKIKLMNGSTGWLPANNLRAKNTQPQSETSLRAQIIADAYTLVGVPYLWAGSSAYGIDCSGFSQWTHRLSGIELPRDADMQMENGRVVESSFQPGDLMFFGQSGAHRRISHVGISLGGWEMIHSSRSKNGVYVDNVQEVTHLRETFLGTRTYIG